MSNTQAAFERVRQMASFLGIHVPHPPLLEPRMYGSDEYLFVIELNGTEKELRVKVDDMAVSEYYDGSYKFDTDDAWTKLNEFYKAVKS